MKTLSFTNEELEILQSALAAYNDYTNDTLFENTSVDLFPRDGAQVTLNQENSKVLREELYTLCDRVSALRSTMTKVGLNVTKEGYSAPN